MKKLGITLGCITYATSKFVVNDPTNQTSIIIKISSINLMNIEDY